MNRRNMVSLIYTGMLPVLLPTLAKSSSGPSEEDYANIGRAHLKVMETLDATWDTYDNPEITDARWNQYLVARDEQQRAVDKVRKLDDGRVASGMMLL